MKEMGGARLNLETEFFRKNNNLTLTREKKIRSVQIKSIHLLLMFLLVLALGYAGNRFCQFLLTWDRLNVRSFRLVNSPQYEKDQVDRILKLHRGNILMLKLEALKNQLLQLNEIAGVSVSRRLPSTVEVVFALRTPVFQILRKGRYWILDAEGRPLAPLAGKSPDLMMIESTAMSDVKQVARRAADLGKIGGRIEYVGYRPLHGLELKLKDAAEVFYPGDGGVAEKLNAYFRIKDRLQAQSMSVRSVDMRMANRIYLEFPEEGIGANEK
jgi:cell division septal protein FtsQ